MAALNKLNTYVSGGGKVIGIAAVDLAPGGLEQRLSLFDEYANEEWARQYLVDLGGNIQLFAEEFLGK